MSGVNKENILSIEYIRAAHAASFENEESIKASAVCGCFYCEKVFSPTDIGEDDWVDDRNAKTALCPYCGIDSVIGDASGFPLNASFLHEMYLVWFENSRHDELWS